MPRNSAFDSASVAALLAGQHGVISRSQALAGGMSPAALRHRTRNDGPWRRLLPGVYLARNGAVTADQLDLAALLYAGPGSVLTGAAALRRHRLAAPPCAWLDVLVPATRRRASHGFARLHRTARLPELVAEAGPVLFTLPPRAVADAVRGLTDLGEVRATVADAVQHGMCPPARLAEELARGPVQGSARLRLALAEVGCGIRSAAEADLRDLILGAGLPMPMFNPRLFSGREFIAIPDCWWPDAGVAAEADSREWHLSPAAWQRTMTRHARMSGHGIIVLHFTPRQIRTEREAVASAIASALSAARGRALPGVRAVAAR